MLQSCHGEDDDDDEEGGEGEDDGDAAASLQVTSTSLSTHLWLMEFLWKRNDSSYSLDVAKCGRLLMYGRGIKLEKKSS